MIKTLNTLFVTMFGLGKLPKIPGTFGSLSTIIIALPSISKKVTRLQFLFYLFDVILFF